METDNKLTYHKLLWYIIIFSLLGLAAEFLYGFLILGVIQFRKGLILGPLSIAYGISAVIMILVLKRFKGHKFILFIIGAILGSFLEYFFSFILEGMLGVRFWNFIMIFNLNGRVCLLHSIIFGFLSVVLIEFVIKWIDKLIDKMYKKSKVNKIINIILNVIIILEVLFTCWGIIVYKKRADDIYNEVKVFEEKNFIEKIGENIFTDNLMNSIYPKIRFVSKDGQIIMINELVNK